MQLIKIFTTYILFIVAFNLSTTESVQALPYIIELLLQLPLITMVLVGLDNEIK